MEGTGVLFRTAISGFNKSDVMAYLDKQNADFRAETERLTGIISSKDEEIKALAEENEKLREQGGKPDTARIEELEAHIAELEAEKAAVKPEETDTESVRKAELYDGMSSQFGDILLKANKQAEEIIAKANEEAERIKREADEEAKSRSKAYADKISALTEDAKESVKLAAQLYKGYTVKELEEMKKVISEAIAAVSSRTEELDKKADEMKESVDYALDKACLKATTIS